MPHIHFNGSPCSQTIQLNNFSHTSYLGTGAIDIQVNINRYMIEVNWSSDQKWIAGQPKRIGSLVSLSFLAKTHSFVAKFDNVNGNFEAHFDLYKELEAKAKELEAKAKASPHANNA